jgi:hypothetical protein
MNTSYVDFVKDRLTSSPNGSEWISIFLAPGRYSPAPLIQVVKESGYLCQTLSSEHADRVGTKNLVQMAENFIKHEVVVLLTCQNQEDFLKFVNDIEEWKTRHINADQKGDFARGRFWILIENTNQNQLHPALQRVADYSCQL